MADRCERRHHHKRLIESGRRLLRAVVRTRRFDISEWVRKAMTREKPLAHRHVGKRRCAACCRDQEFIDAKIKFEIESQEEA